jgi:hypothetical protein
MNTQGNPSMAQPDVERAIALLDLIVQRSAQSGEGTYRNSTLRVI